MVAYGEYCPENLQVPPSVLGEAQEDLRIMTIFIAALFVQPDGCYSGIKERLMTRKYQVIYADPPWAFNFQKRNGLSDDAKGRLYPTMKGRDIVDLPVGEIADDDCVLFLWVMNSELPLAFRCIKEWGFTYKTVAFTWVKTTVTGKYCFGGGNWTRSNPELCLLATKGKPKRRSASVRELVVSERREHSRKPDEIRGSIVELCGDVPRVELFCRYPAEGWDSIGNEIDGNDIAETLKLINKD